MKTLAVVVALAVICFTASASAEIIGVEQFDYLDGPVANQNGGTFWDYRNFDPVGHDGAASNWDNVFGAPAVSSGRLGTNNSGAKREYHADPESDGAVNDPASVPSSVAKAVYYRVTVTTGATVPDFFVLSSYDFETERIYFGKPFGQPNFGLGDGSGPDTNTGPAVQPNTTYTLVARLDYVANTIALYVDPDLNAPEPATAAASATYNETFWSTALRLASGSGDPIIWDDLVVATTWDDLGTVVTTAADENDPSLGGGTGISLREAVNHSPTGSLVTFAPALNGRTITLTGGRLVPPGALTIDASSLPFGLTIDGNNASALFFVNGAQVEGLRALTLKFLTLRSGNAGGSLGGAVRNSFATLRVHDCTFTGNQASDGGAIFSETNSSGLTEVLRSTFHGNTVTDGRGGAIRNDLGTTLISFCTISGNSAPTGNGGGVASFGDSLTTTVVSRSIVSANSGGDVEFTNDITNSFVSFGHNLIGDGNATGAFTAIDDQTGITDPKLSPLAWFGGSTMTMHPLAGSPAIDAGPAADFGVLDQRWVRRIIDGDGNGTATMDIGAVEAGAPVLVTTLADEDDGTLAPGNGTGTSLREAVNHSPGVSVIRFAPALEAELITLNGSELAIPAPRIVFIDTSNLSFPVHVSGDNARRIFNIAAGATVAIHRLVLTDGKAPNGSTGNGHGGNGEDGGAIRNAGQLSLIQCSIFDGQAGHGGNGHFTGITDGGNGGRGGAIFSTGPLSLNFCNVSGNQAGDGGAGASGGSGGGRGGAGGDGGAIFSAGPLRVIDSFVSANEAGSGGNVPTTGIDASGGAGGRGGGLFSSDKLEVLSSEIRENRTGNGGSVFGSGGQSNSGGMGGDGGGIFSNGALSVASSAIAANRTGAGGSAPFGEFGIFIAPAGNGGGVYGGGSFDLLSSTLVSNEALFGSVGGGLHVGPGARGIVTHATIVGNTSFGGAGVSNHFDNDANALTLRYSIVAQNSGSFGETSGAFSNDTNLIGGDPKLAPPDYYGGLTFTMPPIPGSPALNAASGSTVPTDQRGLARLSTPDLGAAEFQGASDIARYWESDWDGDGNAFGLEHALGTDPLAPDRNHIRNLRPPTFNAQGQATLTFGRNSSATLGTQWILYRSTDLANWSEIYRFAGNTQMFDPTKVSASAGPQQFTVIDLNPPFPKAFYKLAAGLP